MMEDINNNIEDRVLDISEEFHFVFAAYFRFVRRAKYWIVGFWSILMLWGLATGFEYIKEARDEMMAPEGTRAAKDEVRFEQEFEAKAKAGQLIVYMRCKEHVEDCFVACGGEDCSFQQDCNHTNFEIGNFTESVRKRVLRYSRDHAVNYDETNVMGYYQMRNTPLDLVKCSFVSSSGRETFMTFTTSQEVSSKKRYDMVEQIDKHIIPEELKRHVRNPDDYFIGLTGVDPITKDGSEAAVAQSEKIDAVTMPFAFLLLGYMVRSWRLLLVSLFNMGVALLTALAVLHVITKATGRPPMTNTASLVEVLGLAMSVDYSLFLLRRFRDESMNGRAPEMAVKIMLSQAGHVVMMSSLTIVCVFAGFCFLRSTDLMVQGVACVVIVSMCLVVNMTNTPALLLIFPHFFSFFQGPGQQQQQWFCCMRRENPSPPLQQSLINNNNAEDCMSPFEYQDTPGGIPLQYITSPSATVQRQRGGPYRGWYFRLLKKIIKWPNNLICLVSLYVLVIPLAMQALNLKRNQNLLQAIPRGASSSKVYEDMYHHFPGGTLLPLYMIVEGPQDRNNSILEPSVGPAFFKGAAALTKQLVDDCPGVQESDFTSVAFMRGIPVWYKVAMELLKPCPKHPSICAPYQFEWAQGVNVRNNSILMTIIVSFDPFKGDIEGFIDKVYDVMDAFMENKNDTIPIQGLYLSGTQVGMVADMKVSFGEFPLLVFLTCAVVFVLLGGMLGSAFVVVRLTITVILPLAAMFGLSVLVYQEGILEWTGLQAFQSTDEGFYWYIPLLAFSLCCGLALDYDVLVIARIREHRYAGYHIKAAILKAIWEINSTVVCAGLIMALAFGGLLLSDTHCINQMSFLLTSSVLFDTFVVQSIVVPCVVSFADDISWWPTKMPTTNLVTLEEEIENRNSAYQQSDSNEGYILN